MTENLKARIFRASDVAVVRDALVKFMAEWERQITGPDENVKMIPLVTKADAFIEAVMELAVKRVRADMREPSRVHVAPFTYDEAAAGLGHVE